MPAAQQNQYLSSSFALLGFISFIQVTIKCHSHKLGFTLASKRSLIYFDKMKARFSAFCLLIVEVGVTITLTKVKTFTEWHTLITFGFVIAVIIYFFSRAHLVSKHSLSSELYEFNFPPFGAEMPVFKVLASSNQNLYF